MISVGLTISSHDIAIAVVSDGKLITAIEVERFSRFKHNLVSDFNYDSVGHIGIGKKRIELFSLIHALKTIEGKLNKMGLSLKDTDILVYSLNPEVVKRDAENILKYCNSVPYSEQIEFMNRGPLPYPMLLLLLEDFERILKCNRECKKINYILNYEKPLNDETVIEKLIKLTKFFKYVSISPIYKYSRMLPLLPYIPLSIKIKMSRGWIDRELIKDIHEITSKLKEYKRYLRRIKKESDCVRRRYLQLESYIKSYMDGIEYAWKLALKGARFPRTLAIDHHLAHVASAYYTSGINKTLGISIDGSGEYHSTTVWVVENDTFELIRTLGYPRYSLGMFYEIAGEWIGYGGLEGPSKIMGLAPYGEPNEKYVKVMEKALEIYGPEGEVPYKISDEVGIVHNIFNYLKKVLGPPISWNKNGKPLNKDAVDFAWALQRRFEEAYLATMEWAREITGLKEAVIAGGAALNAKANMELLYSNIFNDFFVFPAANDAGTAIGAALWAYEHVLGGKVKNERIERVFWGPEPTEEEIEEALKVAKRMGYKIEKNVEIEHLVDHLLRNEMVVVYQGGAEFGPRALGHRSIVVDPRIAENWERVNFHKGREWWRPLAPSLLLEHAKDYFVEGKHLPFMIVMERFKDEEACKRVPVVCHVDRTARPQTVTPTIDRNWYNLIKAFGDETGEYLVMNTSFNLGGEPLVETPTQALLSFTFGGFDVMWMEGYLIRRR